MPAINIPGVSIILRSSVSALYSASDYFVDNSRPDDTGDGLTPETAKKTIEAGLALLSAGDQLGIANGTYLGTGNVFSAAGAGNNNIPLGNASNWVKIVGESVGGVEVQTGLNINQDEDMYTEMHNIVFTHSDSKGFECHWMKFFSCYFRGGNSSGNTAGVGIGTNDYLPGASNFLFEDCGFYGQGGRYKLVMFQAQYLLFRRCVFRHDAGWDSEGGSEPTAVISEYNSQYVEFQNCIAVDNDLRIDSIDGSASAEGVYYIHTNNASGYVGDGTVIPADDVFVRGCININSDAPGGCPPIKTSYPDSTNVNIYDFASVTHAGIGCLNQDAYDTASLGIENFLLFNDDQTSDNVAVYGSNLSTFTLTMKNGIIKSCDYVFNESANMVHSYNNWNNYVSLGTESLGTGEVTTDPESNGLLYPVRIESGSNLATAGESGGVLGPTILKRIGVSGTMYGDSGYNTTTEDDLWPFPNEDVIKTLFSAVSTRGFCAAGNDSWGRSHTLSRYVWQSIGNEVPDVYGLRA